MEKFEEKGVFWVPGKDLSLSGVLRFDPEKKIELEIFSSTFNEKKIYPMFSGKFHHEIILGVISGKKVTLYNCHQHEGEITDPGFLTLFFNINTIFMGCHFEESNDIRFDSLCIGYSYLDDWVGRTGFKVYPVLNSERQIEKYSTTYEYPKEVTAKIDDFQIKISFDFIPIHNKYKIDLKQNTYIEIIPNENKLFKVYKNEIMSHIEKFLSLGIGEPLSPLRIEGKIKKSTLNDGDLNYSNIEVYYPTITAYLPIKRLEAYEMFFSFEDISENFEKCLINWFKKYENLKPVFELYFGTLNNPTIYLENKFLNLAQAAESYHRRTYEGKYIPTRDYKELSNILKNSIPEFVNEEHKLSLNSKIDFGNEYSLQTRLLEIFDKYEDIFGIIISDKITFIKDVKNTRNFLTHYSKSLEKKAKTETEDLMGITEELKFFVEICFLIELGLNSDKIHKLISQDNRYNNKYHFYE